MIQTLLVDDEPLTVEYLDRFLTGIYGGDIQIHTASNGREAADRLCQFHIDLIISDIRMPVMDGLELAKINQEQKTPAHMILLSGYEDFHYAQSAIKYGVSDYLLKPLNREELALAVQKQIGHVKDSRRQQKTYLQFLAHSDAYRLLIGQNLIAAIAHQENLRLQQYYKISCELNLEEIQTDGAILLLEVDNWCGPCAQLSVREHGVYSMILAQQTNEVMAQAHIPGFSVPEPDGKTMVYLSGEDAFQIQKNARTLYKRALNHFRLQTSMSASGALGGSIRTYCRWINLINRRAACWSSGSWMVRAGCRSAIKVRITASIRGCTRWPLICTAVSAEGRRHRHNSCSMITSRECLTMEKKRSDGSDSCWQNSSSL